MMMMMRSMYFLGLVAIFLILILGYAAYFYARYRHREMYPYGRWEDLLKRLGRLDYQKLALIARDSGFESDRQREDEEDEDAEKVWKLLGGMHGLEVMEKNCEVLVDLAFYVQQWYPEALLIAEQLRLNAREVEWHLGRLRAAMKAEKRRSAASEYIQQAVAIYFQMTQEVLSLYEQANIPGLAELQRAL
jgi:hypothetical protein